MIASLVASLFLTYELVQCRCTLNPTARSRRIAVTHLPCMTPQALCPLEALRSDTRMTHEWAPRWMATLCGCSSAYLVRCLCIVCPYDGDTAGRFAGSTLPRCEHSKSVARILCTMLSGFSQSRHSVQVLCVTLNAHPDASKRLAAKFQRC